MRRSILWLDDYFDTIGELGGATRTGDIEIASDFQDVASSNPDIRFFSEQSVQVFVQRLIDMVRLKRALAPERKNAQLYDLLIIDIMIDNVEKLLLPQINGDTGGLEFDDRNKVKKWMNVNAQPYNVGLIVAEHFVRAESALAQIPIIFYTHRPATDELVARVKQLPNSGILELAPKAAGLEALSKAINRMLN